MEERRGVSIARLSQKGKRFVSKKKKHHFEENAVIKKKYFKMLKRVEPETLQISDKIADEHEEEQQIDNGSADPSPKRQKRLPSKPEPFFKANKQREANLRAKEEAKVAKEAEIQAAIAKRAAAEEKRRQSSKQMRKKTQRGQPVMKHRIESMIAKMES
eukprot:c9027_g1_i1.p3 GENE.c9027_g1_i1~~c9027_g1_i1.p3  ORF type:complete len:159 (-),score=43.09 c9027_g1_i1:755-1231(-)